jgi:hypothetical protein
VLAITSNRRGALSPDIVPPYLQLAMAWRQKALSPPFLQGGLRQMLTLKLEVNAEKTRICKMPDETFDFLGYTWRYPI